MNSLENSKRGSFSLNHAVEHSREHCVYIRGQHLDMRELVSPDLSSVKLQEQWKKHIQSAAPYPHLSVTEWFNPDLLNLIIEEFEISEQQRLLRLHTSYQDVHRSQYQETLGPATELYFSLINSSWFVQLLSNLTGVGNLIVDHSRFGGGMHTTKRGGHFAIHSDYNRHKETGLTNKMVFITYLSDWQQDWGGELELWDCQGKQCVTKINPELGRSVLMLNGRQNYHGHPTPWNAPDGAARRSVANYYFANDFAKLDSSVYNGSVYISPANTDKIIEAIRLFVPPIAWRLASKLLKRHKM